MSVDNLKSAASKTLKTIPPDVQAFIRGSRIQDVIVRFLGYHFRQGLASIVNKVSDPGGEPRDNIDELAHPLIVTDYKGVLKRLMQDPDYAKTHKPPLMKIWRASYPGQGRAGKNLAQALDFIRDNFDPRGQVHIIGESMGGENAVRLAKYIAEDFPFVEIDPFGGRNGEQVSALVRTAPALYRWWRFARSEGPNTARVRVDRVSPLDAAWDKDNPAKDCTIPENVVNVANYWQDQFDTDDRGNVVAKHGSAIAPGDDTVLYDYNWSANVKNEADKHNKVIALAHAPVMSTLESCLKTEPNPDLGPLCPARP